METMRPKPFVFVLIPFKDSFDDIYELGIKAACTEAGGYCERVDEQFFDGSILERVYHQIDKADVIVADMTGQNPNVFYETGYAHALGKRVVLLTQKEDDIPFDLKHYSHIVYEGKIKLLKEQLQKRVQWAIEHPSEALSRVEFNLILSVLGKSLGDKPAVHCRAGNHEFGVYVPLSLGIHNPTNKVADGSLFKLGLITPYDFPRSRQTQSVAQLNDDQYLHLLPAIGNVFPGGWESINFDLLSRGPLTQDSFEMSLRVFTELGPRDLPFTSTITLTSDMYI